MLPTWAHADRVIPTVPDPERYPIAAMSRSDPSGSGGQARCATFRTWRSCERRSGVFPTTASQTSRSCRRSLGAARRPFGAGSRRGATVFARLRIGIMPLPDTPYTRAKAGFKLLHYMAAGVPVVASPVGINRQLVGDSGSGFLAEGPDEWEAAIRSLAGDAVLREHLGSRGRAFVERYADLDGQADALAEVLRGPA